MAECGKSEPIELANIRKRIKQKSHGTHAVVTGAPGKPGEHSVVVANIRGVVYLVDAYNTPGVVSQDIERYLGHLEPFEITFNADIHMVPADKASKFTCRR
jgi:hypothetical protein